MKKPKLPPRMTARQLKAGGFSNSLWRLDERNAAAKAARERRDLQSRSATCKTKVSSPPENDV